MTTSIVATADVHATATVGDGTAIWHLAQVREDARVGSNCVVGRGAYVGAGVAVGDNCKLQNYSLVYEPANLGNGVFIGPAAVLTNDTYPRAVNPAGDLKDASEWDKVGVDVGDGASIGARSVCVAPLTIGAWSLVAAGAVVTRDVPAHALVAGVPARQIGWVGHAGRRLIEAGDGRWTCPATQTTYAEEAGTLTRLETERQM